jgi:hypothetical protein
MRAWLGSLLVVAGCALGDGEAPAEAPAKLDAIWAKTIRPGDVVVLIPGTASVDYLAAPIEALGVAHPVVNVREHDRVREDAVVFEQALAAAHRAGISNEQIESGELTFLLWGAGITKLTAFDYVSFDGVRMRIDILGGQNSCAVGGIVDNYFNYSLTSADIDARDAYSRLGEWLAAHPSPNPRNAIVMAHSWGGAVAEYLSLEYETILAELGPLPGGAAMPFTVAAGVPGFVVGYQFIGPRAIDFERPSGARMLYEIDRPDDPVHNMTFEGDFGGHHYEIVVGDDYLGFYGITTDQMSCRGAAGPCAY